MDKNQLKNVINQLLLLNRNINTLINNCVNVDYNEQFTEEDEIEQVNAQSICYELEQFKKYAELFFANTIEMMEYQNLENQKLLEEVKREIGIEEEKK